VQKPGFAYSADRLRERNETLRAQFVIYSNCKSTVSSVRGCRIEIFFNGKTRASFFKPARSGV
jgi:hypothetical protein